MKNGLLFYVTILLLMQGCGGSENPKVEDDTTLQQTEDTTGQIEESPKQEDLNDFIDLPIHGNFSRVGAKIVKEDHSNLYWQDDKEAKTTIKTFNEGKAYCEALTLGGITSWRLPTYKELMSIVDYAREQPSINDEFQNCAQASYWSSTKLTRDNDQAWYVYFREAESDFQYITELFSFEKNIRCVTDEFANRRSVDTNFTRAGNIVTDNIHHLQWQDETKTKVEKYTFSEAEAYCASLTLDGFGGWRVPSVKEYMSILDVTNNDPSTYDDFLYTAYNKPYWTNNERVNQFYGWYMDFENGEASYLNYHFEYYVRCVRGE